MSNQTHKGKPSSLFLIARVHIFTIFFQCIIFVLFQAFTIFLSGLCLKSQTLISKNNVIYWKAVSFFILTPTKPLPTPCTKINLSYLLPVNLLLEQLQMFYMLLNFFYFASISPSFFLAFLHRRYKKSALNFIGSPKYHI